MAKDNKKILILDAYSRQTLPLIRGFKEIGQDVTVVGFSKLDVGLASKLPNRKIKLKCDKDDYDKQYNLYTKLIKTGKFDLVIPTTDYSAKYLSQNKAELSNYAAIAVNGPQIFELAIDKSKTMKLCEEASIPAPKTLFTDDPVSEIKNGTIDFPIVVKPKSACGSIGFNIVYDEEHLQKVIESYDDSHGEYFIQEYIASSGPQYGAEVYRTKDGEFGFVLIDKKPRWFPIDGGSPTINITIHNEQMKESAKKLLEVMDYHGYANIDFLMDERDGIAKVIEVNARTSATLKLDECADINVAKYIYEDAFATVTELEKDYEDDLRVSCILTELLWFLKSKNRFKVKPSMFNRRHTKDVIFSVNDIKPFFTFCIQSIKNFRHAMDERKRS